MKVECLFFGLMSVLMTEARHAVTDVFAESGSQAVLPCACSSSSTSSASIIWRKEQKGTVWRKNPGGMQFWGMSWLQRVRCPHTQFERGDCSLQINSVREEDGGSYVCQVKARGQSAEHRVTLRVVKVSFSPAAPVAGSNVSVTCSVTPRPPGATIAWKLNDGPLAPPSGISSTGDTAVVEEASVTLAGKWTCVVGYRGKEGRASAALSVKGILQPARDDMKVYAALGSAATLPCVFSPGLNLSETRWQKVKPSSSSGTVPVLPPLSSSSSQSDRDKSVGVTQVGWEDAGGYRCSGTADGQRLARDIQLVVARIDSVIPPEKTGGVTLSCQLTDTSDVTDYEWVHVTFGLSGTRTVVHRGQSLTLSEGSDEKEWTCRFYGKQGILGNVTFHVHQTGALRAGGVSQSSSVTVALVLLLVVLLLIGAQLYKNQLRRKEIHRYPALETIIHGVYNKQRAPERSLVKT